MDSAQVKIVKTVRVSTGRPMVPMDELDTVWFCPFAQPCSWVKITAPVATTVAPVATTVALELVPVVVLLVLMLKTPLKLGRPR